MISSTALVARLADAAAALEGADFAEVADGALDVALRVLARVSRRIDAVTSVAVAERTGRMEASGRSAGSAAAACAEVSGTTVGEARRRAEAGRRHGTPAMQAVAAGRISAAHERVIAEHLDELPRGTAAQIRDGLADRLIHQSSRGASPRAVAAEARRELAEIDPTRPDRVEETQQRLRALRLSRPGADGVSAVGISCEPRLQALLAAVVARFGGPGQCVATVSDPETGARPSPADLSTGHPTESPGGLPPESDTRTPEQRAYDALCHVVALGLESSTEAARGVAAIVVRVTPEQLEQIETGGGLVETDSGAQLSARQAVSMAGRRRWFVSAAAEGREELRRIEVDRAPAARLASAIQRLVLYAAHGGCGHPGCEQPAARCQAHHVRPWRSGGPTTIENLTHVCPTHHGWIGAGREQWRTVPRPGEPGRARWIPPGTPTVQPWLRGDGPEAEPLRDAAGGPAERDELGSRSVSATPTGPALVHL